MFRATMKEVINIMKIGVFDRYVELPLLCGCVDRYGNRVQHAVRTEL